MDNQTTKIYYNSTDKDITVGLDVIEAKQTLSITTQFQPPVVLANYPGLVDITDTGLPSDNAPTSSSTTQNDEGATE